MGGYGALASKNTRRRYRENKVDAAVLPKLTAEDLKELGVAAVKLADHRPAPPDLHRLAILFSFQLSGDCAGNGKG